MKDKNYNISFKKEIIYEILNKIILLKDSEVIIDWNLKNFIMFDNEIYYIDFTPVFYRKNVMSINSKKLKPYTDMLLDNKIQFCSFLGYVCIYLIYLPKKVLKSIFDELILFAKDNGIIINKIKVDSHLLEKKLFLIYKYLNGNMSRKKLINNLSKYSMKNLICNKRGD